MDKTIEQIFKTFTHISRDIQTYILAGFVLLCNIRIIDMVQYNSYYSKLFEQQNHYIILLIIFSYILGQICLSTYTLLIEIPRFDNKLYDSLFKKRYESATDNKDELQIEKKTEIFLRDKDIYFHFIERNVNLSLMRWNISSALFISSTISLIYYFVTCNNFFIMLFVVNIVASILIFILIIMTQKENSIQLKTIIEKLKK